MGMTSIEIERTMNLPSFLDFFTPPGLFARRADSADMPAEFKKAKKTTVSSAYEWR